MDREGASDMLTYMPFGHCGGQPRGDDANKTTWQVLQADVARFHHTDNAPPERLYPRYTFADELDAWPSGLIPLATCPCGRISVEQQWCMQPTGAVNSCLRPPGGHQSLTGKSLRLPARCISDAIGNLPASKRRSPDHDSVINSAAR